MGSFTPTPSGFLYCMEAALPFSLSLPSEETSSGSVWQPRGAGVNHLGNPLDSQWHGHISQMITPPCAERWPGSHSVRCLWFSFDDLAVAGNKLPGGEIA